ncbi:MAG TPA: LPS assembly lipoprotein LptE [Burkholderiales bacterium]|nr:LPS assembly lipoprotein LptE [Burkholderiales bacterium]
MTRALLALSAALLAGCGFHLRGTAVLPFDTIYLPATTAPGIVLDLRRNILAGTKTRVVDDPKKAEAVMEFTQEARDKVILSLGADGRVREYELRYRVGFRVRDPKGGEFVPTSTVQLQRDVTFNDSAVLSKEIEDQQLYRDMQSDMVRQIMARLAAAERPKTQ